MKKIFTVSFAFFLMLIITSSHSYGQSANISLSNLAAPTSINQNLLPNGNNKLNLGSTSKGWKKFYLTQGIYRDTFRVFFADTNNVAVGNNSLAVNTGSFNTATGAQALRSNGYGAWNTGNGTSALLYNTSGSANTAIGGSTMYSNVSGSYNTATGFFALALNKTGSSNVAYGNSSLYSNTVGYSNIAIGSFALYKNSTSSNLTAIGDSALLKNTSGTENTAVGSKTLSENISGSGNTAIGYMALPYSTASDNTATGTRALEDNGQGSENTADGSHALYSMGSGFRNTGIGAYALGGTHYSSYNTSVGYRAGESFEGSYNTFLGAYSKLISNNLSNATAIGNQSLALQSNMVVIGNSNVTNIGGYADWTNISDGRFKKNIKEDVPGLAFINKLKPITYNLDVSGLRKFLREDVATDKNSGKEIVVTPDEKTKLSIQKKEAMLQTGFVAQEVEKAAKELGYDFSGVAKPENENTPYSLRYAEFVVPLVKAVQELSKQNDTLKSVNEDLEKKYSAQQKEIEELKALIQTHTPLSTVTNQKTISSIQSARLEQNHPNPTAQSTTIKYFIPQQTVKAVIKITNANGQEIKSINLSQKGNGQINLQTNDLTAGTYFYSLIIDGKTADTKKMIITH